jgi:hypothetical protein
MSQGEGQVDRGGNRLGCSAFDYYLAGEDLRRRDRSTVAPRSSLLTECTESLRGPRAGEVKDLVQGVV